MTTFCLTVIILALAAYIAWSEHEHRQERRHLTHVIVAKNPAEVAKLDDPPLFDAPFIAPEVKAYLDDGEPVGI